MFSTLGLDHVVFRVKDSARMEAFYRDALGCDVVRRREDLGLVHIRVGRSMVDLVSVDGPLGREGGSAPGREGRNVAHLCLRVEPFDPGAIRAHLARFGIEATEPSSNFGAEGEGPSLYLQDPEGNTLELKGPAAGPPRPLN
ncbi:MAG TPA: VOC family protein [Holophagaceae bacterium]|jgi:catechol 2,3-dioxygenase-like lactoylglutathione lyase family enzyme|nr:VOC family protein [Holophagaceae bacterium]